MSLAERIRTRIREALGAHPHDAESEEAAPPAEPAKSVKTPEPKPEPEPIKTKRHGDAAPPSAAQTAKPPAPAGAGADSKAITAQRPAAGPAATKSTEAPTLIGPTTLPSEAPTVINPAAAGPTPAKPARASAEPQPIAAEKSAAPPIAQPAAAIAHAEAPEPEETKISLQVRDPIWLYAYWEIARDKRELFRVNHRRMALRVHDLGSPANGAPAQTMEFFDIGVMPKTRGWYIRTPQPNRRWRVEVGAFDSDGNFLPICESNVVETPKAGAGSGPRVSGAAWSLESGEPRAASPMPQTPAMPRFQEPMAFPSAEPAPGFKSAPVPESRGPGASASAPEAEEERMREIFLASLGEEEEEEVAPPGASENASRRRPKSELGERESRRLRELRAESALRGGASELAPGASNLRARPKRGDS